MDKSFYYKYSEYSAESIMNSSYKEIAEKMLTLATTEEMKDKLKGILFEGGFGDFSVNLESAEHIPLHKDSPDYESERRLQYAYFLIQNPEAFESIVKNNTILFHGTRVDALPSILKYGMNSLHKSVSEGIDVTTAEEWSRIPGKDRRFISFTDSLGLAMRYTASDKSNENDKQDSFGIMIGIAPDALKDLRGTSVHSDLSEIGIMDHVPLQYIKVLTVPKEKVEFVRKLVGELDIEVVGAEMDSKFYFMDRSQKKEYLAEPEKYQQSPVKEYSKEDMGNMARQGVLSRIMQIFKGKDRRNGELCR